MSFVVMFDSGILVTLLLPQDGAFMSGKQILDDYAEWGGFDRERLTGAFSQTLKVALTWNLKTHDTTFHRED